MYAEFAVEIDAWENDFIAFNLLRMRCWGVLYNCCLSINLLDVNVGNEPIRCGHIWRTVVIGAPERLQLIRSEAHILTSFWKVHRHGGRWLDIRFPKYHLTGPTRFPCRI